MNRITIGLATAITFGGATLMVASSRPDKLEIQRQDPPMAGIHWARGERAARPSKSPNLVYHGGPVLHGTLVEPIFWGGRWTDSTFVNDKVTGVQTFYGGIGASSYAQTNTEYTDSTGHVSASVSLGATRFDFSDVTTNGQRTGPILAEVCAKVPSPQSNGYYPVYVDVPRGHARFCAWHSAGACPNGTTVQFAFFFNLDGDPGCDPEDTSGLHSQGLAALANVSGHEISEALTDPRLNAWYDSNGEENADKCAWSFGTPLLTFHNGLQWRVQGNWSNAAFTGNSGYANRDGQNGCIDGGNFK